MCKCTTETPSGFNLPITAAKFPDRKFFNLDADRGNWTRVCIYASSDLRLHIGRLLFNFEKFPPDISPSARSKVLEIVPVYESYTSHVGAH